jgi:four helix bundle protein
MEIFNSKKIVSFKDLQAWQAGHRLVMMIYELTSHYPKEERYSLVDQMRRSAISVTSNIAEGFGRRGYAEKARFYSIALGSLSELDSQAAVSRDIKYIKDLEFSSLTDAITDSRKLTNGLLRKTRSFIRQTSET